MKPHTLRLLLSNCLNWKIYCDDHSSLSSAFVAGCGGNYHKKCAYKIPNNCSDSRHRTSSTIVNSPSNTNTLPRPSSQVVDPVLLQHSNSLNDSMPSLKERRATWSGRSVWIEPALSGRIQVPHSFAIHSYKRPTNCQICKRLVSDMSPIQFYSGIILSLTWGQGFPRVLLA